MLVAGMRRVEPGLPYRASSCRSADVDTRYPGDPPASNLTQTARRPFLCRPGAWARAPRHRVGGSNQTIRIFRSWRPRLRGLASRRGGRVRYLHDRLMRGYAVLFCESSRGGVGTYTLSPLRHDMLSGPVDLPWGEKAPSVSMTPRTRARETMASAIFNARNKHGLGRVGLPTAPSVTNRPSRGPTIADSHKIDPVQRQLHPVLNSPRCLASCN